MIANTVVMSTAQRLQDGTSPSASVYQWPADTDLKVLPGPHKKVILTIQSTPLRTVIQDSFEHLRASLLFEHAFPDSVLVLLFIRNALVTAAERCGPTLGPVAMSIRSRLLNDNDYFLKISPLVSTSEAMYT
jgi:hypothetical protein